MISSISQTYLLRTVVQILTYFVIILSTLFSQTRLSTICIDVAPITQVTHVRNKNSNIQGRSPNVIKTFSML